jgi:dihydrodipicolinate synthase/N-acetylneuraminate lyase
MAFTVPGDLQKRLRGVQIIMVTPFDKERKVSVGMVKELTRYLIAQGIREGRGVLVTQGSMSECFSVDIEERKKIVRSIVEEAGTQVPVVVGCNATDTRTVIHLCQSAQQAGADGVMVMPPYYFAPSNEEILQFYRSLTESIDIGVVLYNNVQVCIDIELEVLQELAEMEKIIALKDCTADFTKFKICAEALADKVTVLNGGGPLWEPQATLAGAKGFYTLAGNFAPGLALQLWQACDQGDYQRAENLSRQFVLYIRFMREARKSIQLTKMIMRDLGLPGGFERPPLLPLTGEEEGMVLQVKRQMGLGG